MSSSKLGQGESYRLFEKGGIVAFVLFVLMILFFNPSAGRGVIDRDRLDAKIEAYAFAMPNQGWAPMTVYFSAFGSKSQVGEIVKYEWDLDGNGLYDTDTVQKGGYVSYSYAKPGEYTITLRVTDDQRNTATYSVLVNVQHPASSSVDYWTVFDDSRVRRVDLFITQQNWERIWSQPEAKLKVEADINLFGERINNVGLSIKGNASLGASGDKKSWKIDTDEFVDGQEYQNLKQLLFHNNFMDASMLREKMAYDMMGFAGVPTSHTAFVELWIDIKDDDRPPTYWGVYTMVERLDKKYVDNRFGQDSQGGNLYKADAWFEEGAADLAYYGENIEDYPKPRGEIAYHLRTNKEEPDYSDIINLCRVIDGVDYETPADFGQALETVFNVDGYLRYIAVIFTNLNLDTYPYTGNNYFIYHNLATGKFEFLPWDMNNSWGHFAGGAEFPLYGSTTSLGPLEYAPLFTQVFQVPRYRRAYAAYVDLLVRYWFNGEYVGAQAQAWHDLISPYVRQGTGDKMYYGPTAIFSIQDFDRDRIELVNLTRERAEFLLSALTQIQ